ncbi:MAG TPA: nucleoside triphosphate pyrophosphohydrolase [Gemmatimonadales bacterium]|jgi:MazG family protein|nr:nucleoside triphosphate pyrophosphohydrolase [Gemmatimonadales bacterium]
MQDNSALGRAVAMVRDLRVRCAWDRVQTRETLRPYLVEEMLELDQALAQSDVPAIRDELADFLLHLAWQLVLAEERGEFNADDVAETMERKMKRRHPHLFDIGPPEPWERLKRREREDGVLGRLPAALPDLLRAYRMQERAASVGFDWPDAQGPIDKVKEELAEVERELADAGGRSSGGVAHDALADEVGDLLFAVVNLARKTGVLPGPALDRANRKFRERFEAVERLAKERGVGLHSAGLEVLDAMWEEIKRREQ